MKILIRKLSADDIGFITSTWLKNYRAESRIAKSMRKNIYFEEHNKLINDCIVNFNIAVACNVEAREHILAWCCYSNLLGCDLIHYIYCKKVFEEFGLKEKLMEEIKKHDVCIYSHDDMTKEVLKYYDEKFTTYNPYTFTNENYFN